ncbi:hypothetical protein ISF_08886 [Cordyceps fumosorosea ARSEF 2679]|uniref:Uncharacterized protein n=1 Tax=Cordyceps fumosorosea (strain ARSEF 2679) TaxID=1081104 RepID=A0A167LMT8_CORFA|nr:hypothetical protein ISF_08886 [Cordyceps fumosorosea ARSEF 2679]OAA53272.1 hypothetical protein ISF_08886 [Cordyceps fumosorosea ARSEF 2679]
MPSALEITAGAWLLTSLGHTVNGRDWQSHSSIKALPAEQKTCARSGWYQGSGFLFIASLLNYYWSKNPQVLQDPIQKAIAGLFSAILGVSSVFYAANGVAANSVVTGLVSALQAYAAFKAN